jgi:hypothetical protein
MCPNTEVDRTGTSEYSPPWVRYHATIGVFLRYPRSANIPKGKANRRKVEFEAEEMICERRGVYWTPKGNHLTVTKD